MNSACRPSTAVLGAHATFVCSTLTDVNTFIMCIIQSQQSRQLCHLLWSLRGNDIIRTTTDSLGADTVFVSSTAYDVETLPCL